LNDFCDDDNLSTQLIMRLPSVGCHDMCFSIASELIQEFYVELFGIIFLVKLSYFTCPCSWHSKKRDTFAMMIGFLIPAR